MVPPAALRDPAATAIRAEQGGTRTSPGPFRWLYDPAYFREFALFGGSEVERLIRLLRYTGVPLTREGD